MKNKIFSTILLAATLICSNKAFSMTIGTQEGNSPAPAHVQNESDDKQSIFGSFLERWNSASTKTKVVSGAIGAVAIPAVLIIGYKTIKFLYSGWANLFSLPCSAVLAMSKFGHYGPMSNQYWSATHGFCKKITTSVGGFFSNILNKFSSQDQEEGFFSGLCNQDNSVLGSFRRLLNGDQ